MHPFPHATGARDCCLVLAAVALGFAIHVNNGLVHPIAILWLSLAMAAAFAAFAEWPADSILSRHAGIIFPFLVAAGLFAQFSLLALSPVPGVKAGVSLLAYVALLLVAFVLCGLMLAFPRRAGWIFPLVLLTFALLGAWVLHTGARPRIDVWTAQASGLDAMRRGSDPWSSTFADIYHLPDLYAPGTVKDGVVQLGFPYPPLTVLFDLPGYVLLGDYRYSNLAAMLVAAACIAYARPGGWGPALAAMFLFTPRAFLVLANGWTEPTVAMLLAATVFCACRRPAWVPWVLGLFLVSKQYAPLAIIPAILLLPRLDWRGAAVFFGKAILCGAVVSLPLAFWNFTAFLHSNLLVASGAKFRLDALSFFAFFANVSTWSPSQRLGSVSYVAAVVAAVFAVRRGERSPAGFAAATALSFVVFFSLNKFAFCNYYYFVIAALCTSAAAHLSTPSPEYLGKGARKMAQRV